MEVAAGLSVVEDELVSSVDVAGADVVVDSEAAADVVDVVAGISGTDVVTEIVVEISDDVSVFVSVSLTASVVVEADVSEEVGVSKTELEVVVTVVLKREVLGLPVHRPRPLSACLVGEASTPRKKRRAEMAHKTRGRWRIFATCNLWLANLNSCPRLVTAKTRQTWITRAKWHCQVFKV